MEQANNEIHATLAISLQEAFLGTSRALVLPGGRQTTITIPAGSQAGQEIRITDQGTATLILTLVINDMPRASSFNPSSSAGHAAPPAPQGNTPKNLRNSQFVGFPLHSMQTPYPASPVPNIQPYSAPPVPDTQAYPTPPVPNVQSYPIYAQQPGMPYPVVQTGYAQVGQEGTGQPVAGKAAPAKKRPIWHSVVLIFLILLVVVASVLFYLLNSYVPTQEKVHAIATTQSETTRTALKQQAAATSGVSSAATAQINATGTAIAPYVEAYNTIMSGNPVLNDGLSAPSVNNWETNAACTFQNGSYHIIENRSGFFRDCFAQMPTFSNFAFQVQMNILKGDAGGVAFRANPTTGKLYLFLINTDSSYTLYYYPDSSGKTALRLSDGNATTFIQGYNHPNLITIIAKGNTLNLYMNKQYLASMQDSSASTGKIGVIANYQNALTEITYTQAKVWQL